LIIYVLGWFGLAILLMYITGMGAVLAVIISTIVLGIIKYAISSAQYKKQKENENYIIFNEDTDSAKLLKRSEMSASLLTIETIQNTYTKYNPSKMVYTGATVGGVTTGGIHTTEAHLSTKVGGDSGKCHIIAKGKDKKIVEVKNIELSKELLSEAKKDKAISKFIVGDKLVLRYNTPDTKLTREENEILKRAIETFDTALQDNITQRAFIASMPTKEDCLAVKKWVSGK